jgi:hypothetical protein
MRIAWARFEGRAQAIGAVTTSYQGVLLQHDYCKSYTFNDTPIEFPLRGIRKLNIVYLKK